MGAGGIGAASPLSIETGAGAGASSPWTAASVQVAQPPTEAVLVSHVVQVLQVLQLLLYMP